MVRLRTLDLLLIVAILAVPLLVGWSYFRPRMTGMEQQSMSDEVGGLQLAIRSLERQGDDLEIVYTFRWAPGKERKFGFWRRFGEVEVWFSDADSQPVGVHPGPPQGLPFILREGFQFGERALSEHSGSKRIPDGAKYVAINFNESLRSDLTTKGVPLPEPGEAP